MKKESSYTLGSVQYSRERTSMRKKYDECFHILSAVNFSNEIQFVNAGQHIVAFQRS